MAFGGHYLSDVLLGGLITLIVIEVVRRLLWPRGES
jgi:membrane-associated phospholipid phosphatase